MGIVYDFKNAHGMGKGVMPIHRGSNGAISEFPRTIIFIEIFIGFANIILFNHDHGRIYNGDAYF